MSHTETVFPLLVWHSAKVLNLKTTEVRAGTKGPYRPAAAAQEQNQGSAGEDGEKGAGAKIKSAKWPGARWRSVRRWLRASDHGPSPARSRGRPLHSPQTLAPPPAHAARPHPGPEGGRARGARLSPVPPTNPPELSKAGEE